MYNDFFHDFRDKSSIEKRLNQLENGKIGLYSVGLYPASLAYNSVMHSSSSNLYLAARKNRELLGAFSAEVISGMDPDHLSILEQLATHYNQGTKISNNLEYLIQTCDLVVLSSNSNYIECDLLEAIELRENLNRKNTVISILSGSFTHDNQSNQSYILCEKYTNLAFFSGFHRHGALRDPLDSFTANFCHPNVITAMIGANILDNLSPNIQVSAGIHNIEAQYIKATKNISSVLAGFVYRFYDDNSAILPIILTLLQSQCLDQAATISQLAKDSPVSQLNQPFPITELGYGVENISATLNIEDSYITVRDHTFAQLTPIISDIRGSMMMPRKGLPTRNFQAGMILADYFQEFQSCPRTMRVFLDHCNNNDLSEGSLEGIKSLKYWPNIRNKYNITHNDSSLINVLYYCFYGTESQKQVIYAVLTNSRELTSYCQESVRPISNRRYSSALKNLSQKDSMLLLVDTILKQHNSPLDQFESNNNDKISIDVPSHLRAMKIIESPDIDLN